MVVGGWPSDATGLWDGNIRAANAVKQHSTKEAPEEALR
jgi:hypothetical protein